MRCLYCYQPLSENEVDFHASCSRLFFGSVMTPDLPDEESQMKDLADKVIHCQVTVRGVKA